MNVHICRIIFLFLVYLIFVSNLFASDRVINLVVGYKTVSFAGKIRKAIAVNNQIPAPTLHFKQGDHVSINVYNSLNEETAIHWHGILVPWQMDGVLGVNQQGIQPGQVFHYEFTLHQSGTYWYHAHAGLQEQEGLYGAFIIDPPKPPSYHYTKDYVVVLSDWSNTTANQILANLKKEGDYYSPRFPLQPSLAKFIHDYRKASSPERQKLIDDYKMMQQMRMGIYDLSDVAYDAFLLNGNSKCNPWTAPVTLGDTVRLRFIGAAGSTIFNVKIPNASMEMVHVDGNDVIPYQITEFSIAPGETYDVLVHIKDDEPYIIYAESIDTLGVAYGALVTSPHRVVYYNRVAPFPEPLPVTRDMMTMNNAMPMDHQPTSKPKSIIEKKKTEVVPKSSSHSEHRMEHAPRMQNMRSNESMDHTHAAHTMTSSKSAKGMNMAHTMSMNHMNMPTEPTVYGDKISAPTFSYETTQGTKYQNMVAAVETNDPNTPVAGVIKMELFGYMDRYIWFINGLPEYKAKPIILDPDKRYRIIFTNTSMMHHPMHIHGHWFILRNGNGAFDPLLHTIDIPPGATLTADIDTEASGQWFFHCHLLYHMVSGMSRVFQYSSLIEITRGEAKPENIVHDTKYINRPIVRVDEKRPIDMALVKHPMAHPTGFWFANFLDVGEDPFHNVQKVNFKGLYGGDYNKLELLVEDAEVNRGEVDDADIDVFYWRLVSQFWAIKGGANYFYRPTKSPYWQPGLGLEGLLPYFIDVDIRGYYHSSSAKLDLVLFRDTQMTNNFFIRLGLRGILATKTVRNDEIGSGLNQTRFILRPYYRVNPGVNIFIEYENEQAYGEFRRLQKEVGEPVNLNTVTFGIGLIF